MAGLSLFICVDGPRNTHNLCACDENPYMCTILSPGNGVNDSPRTEISHVLGLENALSRNRLVEHAKPREGDIVG